MSTVLEEIHRQAHWCGEFGSPFTKQLLERAAADIEAGGIVARLVDGWTGSPLADAVSLRLAGALHAAALTQRDERLAALYPAADPHWSMEKVWPVARAFLEREEVHVRDFMKSPPQTNETGRATGLAAGFMWLATNSAPQPFHLHELGASAGLNLNWSRFRYAYPPWGRTAGEGPLIPTQVTGTLPSWRDIAIASRAACDQNPLDPSNPADVLRLRAYVWADQPARLERLDAAIALAAASGAKVEKADAAEWTRRKLAPGLPPGTTIIYHSVFYQYPPKAVRQAIADVIEEAGQGATPERQLAWVRFEPEGLVGGDRNAIRYVLDIVRWNGERTQSLLAEVDPHGRFMTWL